MEQGDRHAEEPYPLPAVSVLEFTKESEGDTITFFKKSGASIDSFSEMEGEETYLKDIRQGVNSFDGDHACFEEISSLFARGDDDTNENAERKSSTDENSPYGKNYQSLSYFFTDQELQTTPAPDAILNVKDKYFAVIPNAGKAGHTLFHCLGQVITGKESDHRYLRESIVECICSQEGWDALGNHVMSFYGSQIPELKLSARKGHGPAERDRFQRRAYRHYFMEEDIEGSLIELLAASFLYGFNYTCLFLRENENELGKGTCRIFHCVDNSKWDCKPAKGFLKRRKSKRKFKKMNYFLRVGDSPKSWRWTIVVPYLTTQVDLCKNLVRGTYEAQLWNAYGLDWNRGCFPVRRTCNPFRWKNGTCVIPASSGKLLGGYPTGTTDLFSNLCTVLPNCLHKGNICLLKAVITYCPRTLSPINLHDSEQLANLIIRTKEYQTRNNRKMKDCDLENDVGTMKDLHKASKLFDFGYFVIGIDEQARFRTMRFYDKGNNFYFIVRTKEGKITDWCVLGDMRTFVFDTPSKQILELVNRKRKKKSIEEKHSKCQIDGNKPTKQVSRKAYQTRISRYLYQVSQFIIKRLTRKNKVHQVNIKTKTFPNNTSSDIHDNTTTLGSSSVK